MRHFEYYNEDAEISIGFHTFLCGFGHRLTRKKKLIGYAGIRSSEPDRSLRRLAGYFSVSGFIRYSVYI